MQLRNCFYSGCPGPPQETFILWKLSARTARKWRTINNSNLPYLKLQLSSLPDRDGQSTSGADLMIFMLGLILLITPLMLFQHFSSFLSSLFQQPVCRLLATSIPQRSPHSPLSAFVPDIVNNQTVRPAGRHSALAGSLAAAMAAGYSVLQLSTTLVPVPQFLPSSSPNNAEMTTTTH